MCGISGFTHLASPAPPGRMLASTRTLHHRGPDQQGVYENQWVSLGAVRLKIIDLGTGNQPVTSPDGRATIVFNGEVYNYKELRRDLQAKGARFLTQSDTEVVLAAFRAWGTQAFAKLRGMFAFAIWDETEEALHIVRDRMGIKPLYYFRKGGDLYFASELKALLAHPEIPRRLCPAGLSYFLRLNYIPQPYTLVEGIHKLTPGCYLRWAKGELTQETYWRLSLQPKPASLPQATEELELLLTASIREHLISDVPLGVWASGGLDSTTILHYASDFVPHLKTFSVSFAGRTFDESPWFREVAKHYGTDHHEFDVNPDAGLADAIEQMAYFSDEPSADAGALPVWFLSRLSRQHVTVALSGEGADELFAGYQTYLADRYAGYARFVPSPLRRLALAAAERLPVSDDKISFEYKLKRFLAGSLLSPAEAHLYWNGTNSATTAAALAPGIAPAKLAELYRGNAAGTLNAHLACDQLHYLPEDILYKCDRMSMAHSLEVRPPFLDHRIVEFAARLPEDFKLRKGSLKFVLRELMKDKLPASVLQRPKQGFDIPTHHWFRTILKPLLLATVNEKAVQASGVFAWPAVSNLLEQHLERRANHGYSLWGLLTLFLWMKQWKIEIPITS
ncbi:MAG: asparagine synthase (glutamine-hydrolyzing) [Bryobacter sp.]|nr:asparagine synthase (glutamine-hydrolyzing) [Bryobacter sp.]